MSIYIVSLSILLILLITQWDEDGRNGIFLISKGKTSSMNSLISSYFSFLLYCLSMSLWCCSWNSAFCGTIEAIYFTYYEPVCSYYQLLILSSQILLAPLFYKFHFFCLYYAKQETGKSWYFVDYRPSHWRHLHDYYLFCHTASWMFCICIEFQRPHYLQNGGT